MTIELSNRAKKQYKKLPEKVKKKFEKQLRIYEIDPKNVGLGRKKVVGLDDTWEFRINISYRVVFQIPTENKLTILKIGPHDVLDKKR